MAHAGGRPLKYTLKDMQTKIDKFFMDCDANDIPYTITGLALALDTDRQTLLNYQQKDEFVDTIKKAKLKVENQYEQRLIKNGRSGDIFALKNFGWQDKQEIDQNIGNKDDKPFNIDLAHFTIDELKGLVEDEDKETD